MSPFFTTSRLLVRPFEESDLDAFFAYRNDPDVARYQGWEMPYTLEMARDFVNEMTAKTPYYLEMPHGVIGWYQMTIENAETHQVLGDVAVYFESEHTARIGYTIAQPYWRQGYASEAVTGLLAYLFDEIGVHRVIADCSPENVGSVALLEKLGFRREAHHVENYLNADGTWEDEYLYAMLSREWSAR